MRKYLPLFVCVAGLLGGVSAVAGERAWADCRTCHTVTAPNGDVLARGGRSGPNLYGIAGRPVAGDSDFRLYSDALQRAGASGMRWSQDNFVSYMVDPDAFLQRVTGDPDARSDMHVDLPQGAEALFVYLQDLSR